MFHTVLRRILDLNKDTQISQAAVFMHCTTGNNRTGVFISMLLLFLHVPVQHVVEEYALSEQGLASTRHVNVDRLLKKGAFNEYQPVEARKKCERMIGARSESMEALVKEIERRWGGAREYLKNVVGLTEEEMKRLKEIFTVDGEAKSGKVDKVIREDLDTNAVPCTT
jgi:protein tyrosine/serine phosphatase